MTDELNLARALLDKIDHWNALWHRNIKLPISREEAELIRHLLQQPRKAFP